MSEYGSGQTFPYKEAFLQVCNNCNNLTYIDLEGILDSIDGIGPTAQCTIDNSSLLACLGMGIKVKTTSDNEEESEDDYE